MRRRRAGGLTAAALRIDASRRELLSLGVALLAVLALAGCTGAATRHPRGTPVPTASPVLVLTEEHGDSTNVVLEPPGDAAHTRTVAAIQHRPGWGVRGTVSPDGRVMVYTVLPRDATDPDSQGELWLLPLDGRSVRRLATGVDLRSDLVWSPDSAWVSYERLSPSPGGVLEVRRVNASGAGDELLVTDTPTARWFVMGYSADGAAAFLARIDGSGTAVVRVQPGNAPGAGTTVSAGSSRGFGVSGQGCAALLALTSENGRQVYRAFGCAGGGFVRLATGGIEDSGVAWNPATNTVSIGVVPGPPGTTPPTAAQPDARVVVPPSGFDVPLAWSRDGAYLAIQHFSGATTDQPGEASLVILSSAGTRSDITSNAALAFAGWTYGR